MIMNVVAKTKKRRRSLGLPRVEGEARNVRPHPSRGGSQGYDVPHRMHILQLHDNGFRNILGEPRLLVASESSIYRWNRRLIPSEKNGNKLRLKIHGFDLFLLLFYRTVWPKSNADEVRCFIFQHSRYPTIYSREDICKAEQNAGLSRKIGSTTAYQAFLPENVQRRWMFWNYPPPIGVQGVHINTLIDIDEAAISLLSVVRGSGKAFVNVRVGDIGPYTKGDKFTMIAAVGPPNFRHMFIAKIPGTTAEMFIEFIRNLLLQFPPGTPRKTFLFDNLASHFSDEVAYLIYESGHRFIPRAAYYPADGPIEYIFNQVELGLRRNLYNVRTDDDLVACTRRVFGAVEGIEETFRHCGY